MTDKKKKYLAPEIKVVEIEQTDIICTSLNGIDNEGYGTGDTSDWYLS